MDDVILHKMIVDSRRSGYSSNGTRARSAQVAAENIHDDLVFVTHPPALVEIATAALGG